MSTPASPPRRLQRRHLVEFVKFGLVGGSGVLVNLLVVIILKRVTGLDDAQVREVLFPLGIAGKNFRVFHVFAIVAFLVANLWNFELNRRFTFDAQQRASRRRLLRFFVVGAGAQAVGLVIMSGLMSPSSWIGLPRDVFDGSSGMRTPLYWAQLIQVLCTTPISFVLQKVWTFAAHEDADGAAADRPADAAPVDRASGARRPDAGAPAAVRTDGGAPDPGRAGLGDSDAGESETLHAGG